MRYKDILYSLNNHEIVLDKNYLFLFFTHNKNAQTSINRFLLQDRVVIYKDNAKYWNLIKEHYVKNIQQNKFFTFTIIRNPIDRYISAFAYLQKIKKISKNIDINDWTNNIFKKKGVILDPHFTPQEKYHKPILNLKFDFILNFDNLKKDWHKVANEIRASEHLPHKNQTQKFNYELSKNSCRILEDIYYDDFKLFESVI